MPHHVMDGVHAQGGFVLLLAIKDITDPTLINKADAVCFFHLTQLGKAIRVCLQHHVYELVLVGRVHHNKVFSLSLFRMDWTTIKTYLSLSDKRADSILAAVGDAFEKKGVHLASSVKYLQKYVAPKGLLSQKAPSKKAQEDIDFAIPLARELGRLDIGQTIVVKKQTVVAVEAMEGTDLCLERAGQIAGSGCVVAKLAKPHQDLRYDVPVIGINTLEKLAKIKALGIVIEGGKTVMIDAEMLRVANELKLFILAV